MMHDDATAMQATRLAGGKIGREQKIAFAKVNRNFLNYPLARDSRVRSQ